MSNSLISQNLKHLRLLHGYTQEEINRYLNINRQTYSLYERGARLPSVTLLAQMAALNKVSLDELISVPFPTLIKDPGTLRMLQEYNRLPSGAQKEVQLFVKFKSEAP